MGNVFDKRAVSEGRKPSRVVKRALATKPPKPFDDGMFGVPKGMGGMSFDVEDGFTIGEKGIKQVGSKKTTFRGLGRKEGKRLGMSGKKSAVRKLRN